MTTSDGGSRKETLVRRGAPHKRGGPAIVSAKIFEKMGVVSIVSYHINGGGGGLGPLRPPKIRH